jgi:hypothetical protein
MPPLKMIDVKITPNTHTNCMNAAGSKALRRRRTSNVATQLTVAIVARCPNIYEPVK